MTTVGWFPEQVKFNRSKSIVRLKLDKPCDFIKGLSASNNVTASGVDEPPAVGEGDPEGGGVGVEVVAVGPGWVGSEASFK
jgi:hypothetical protein